MYFIGRLNPPHNGHIRALVSLIETAKEKGSVPLILLGSGPGKARTMDNPIDFETKKQFIVDKLASEEYGFEENTDYVIKEMTNPAVNVAEYVYNGLETSGADPTNIEIIHVAGDKGDDAEKLMFALNAAVKAAERAMPNVPVSKNVAAIAASNAGPAMSATIVRKDAYRSLIDGSGFEGWLAKYGDFYGTNAEAIYKAILYPLNNIPEEEQRDIIVNYLENDTLPVTKKPKRGKAKGLTKRKKIQKKENSKNKKDKRRRQIRTHRKKGGQLAVNNNFFIIFLKKLLRHHLKVWLLA